MANVAIIEDDAYLLDDLSFLVTASGHKCTLYQSADAVLNDIGGFGRFDYVVLDLMMSVGDKMLEMAKEFDPGGSMQTGEILFAQLRQRFPRQKVIVITAVNLSHVNEALSKDPDVIMIQKPINEDKINLLLRTIV